MTSIIRREMYRRGIWGKLWLTLFYAWNIVLGGHTLLLVAHLSKALEGVRGLEGVVWTNLATHVIVRELAVWAVGAVVLGLLVYATRGERYLVETTEEEALPAPAARAGLGLWWIPIVAIALIIGFVTATLLFGIPRH
ncbi:MAG TPA: hypothetical protein VH852_07125 [Hyphomicrobium sp.]|jgi:hypothetical protein